MVKFQVRDDVELRMLDKQDAALLFSLVDKNREYLKRWLPWLDQNTSADDSAHFIESTHKAV